MATDVEKLLVQLSADIKSYERAMQRAVGISNSQAAKIEKRFQLMNRNLDSIGQRAARSLTAPLTAIGAALGLRGLTALTDAWTDYASRVSLAAGSGERGLVVMRQLVEMAQRTYSAFDQTAESYLLNARTLSALGYQTQAQLDYTEALNNALVVSGAKGERARAVTDAMAKAMALGKLSGDELNTVIANGGRVAEALAESMGANVTQLRALGASGDITREKMIGITSQLARLRAEAEAMPATVGDAIVVLKNAMLAYVGSGDQAVGVSSRLAQALLLVANHFDVLADAAVNLAFVVGTALVARSIGRLLAQLPALATALVTVTAALRGGAIAAGALSLSLAPVLAVAAAAAATIYLLSTRQGEAGEAASAHAEALYQLDSAILKADGGTRSAIQAAIQLATAQRDGARQALAYAEAQLAVAEAQARAGQMLSGGARRDPATMSAAERAAYALSGGDLSSSSLGGKYDGAFANVEAARNRLAEIEKRLGQASAARLPFAVPLAPPAADAGGKGKPARAGASAREQSDAVQELIQSLEQEIALVGASELTRETDNNLRRAGKDATELQRLQIIELTKTLYENEAAQKAATEAKALFADTAYDAIDGLIVQGDSLNHVLRDVVRSLEQAALKAALLGEGPLAGLLGAGGSGGVLGSLAGVISGALGIGKNAAGTSSWRGGPSWVGEKGPEIVDLPKGARVIPNHAITAAMRGEGGGNSVANVSVSIQTPDAASFHRSRGQIEAMMSRAVARGQRGL